MKAHILCIDDEQDILTGLRFTLEKEGYHVATATSGEEGLVKMRENMPDLIVLDLMLPGKDGLTICKEIRADSKLSHIPIIMLTAKSTEIDVVLGLEMGADDYLPKPFSNRVLVARIKSLLRRQSTTESQENTITRGPLVINPGRREVFYKGESIELTYTEFELLAMLAKRPGWVFSRAQIVNNIKGGDYPVTERSVDVQVVGLRKRLGEAGDCIETVRGVGYKFKG